MQIREIVSEAISLTKHYVPVQSALTDTVKQSLAKIKSSQFQEFRNRVDRTGAMHTLVREVTERLIYHLKNDFSKTLTNYVRTNIDAGLKTRIKFGGSEFHGSVDQLDITIDSAKIKRLADSVLDGVERTALDQDDDSGSYYDGFFSVIREYSQDLEDFIGYTVDRRLIPDLANTFVHEMVHVLQHKPQIAKGRDSLEYRSYLDPRKKEFPEHDRWDDPAQSKQYSKLYYASPQEITAFAHEAAIRILKDVMADPAYDRSQVSELLQDIPQYAKKYVGTPTNDREKRVYNRYIKLIYQEIQRYLSSL